MDLGLIVAVALAGLAGLIWLIRLEGRVNTHERGCEERQRTLDERHATTNRELKDIKGTVTHMDSKIDRLLERDR